MAVYLWGLNVFVALCSSLGLLWSAVACRVAGGDQFGIGKNLIFTSD